MLVEINERTHIEKRGDCAEYTEDGENWFPLPAGTPVSMNFWGFTGEIMDELVERFPKFLEEAVPANPLKSEYLIPSITDDIIKDGKANCKVLTSTDKWYGVTYKEDKAGVVSALNEKIEKGFPK